MSDTVFVQNVLKDVYTVQRFGSVKSAQYEAYAFLRERVTNAVDAHRFAMRHGMKHAQQIEWVTKALKKRLADSQIEPDVADPATAGARLGRSDGCADIVMRHTDIRA